MKRTLTIEKSQSGMSVHNAEKLKKFTFEMLSNDERDMLVEMLTVSKKTGTT